jgi:hypothetical protein
MLIRTRCQLGRWLATAFVLVIAGADSTCGQQLVTLQGTVVDPAQNALPRTAISVYGRDGALLAEGETNRLGQYSLRVVPGNPIVRVVYDNRKYQIDTVDGLSARPNDEHTINKVLFYLRGPERFESIVQQILTYDRLRLVSEFESKSSLNFATTPSQLDEHQKAFQQKLRARYGSRMLNIPHPLRQTWRDHPLYDVEQYDEQRSAVADLTPLQQNVIDRLMGDLLFRYGYTAVPIYQRPQSAGRISAPAPP